MVRGFIVRELSPVVSNWRSKNRSAIIWKNDIPGLDRVDTRALTKKLRVHGAMKACFSTEDISDDEAVRRAREWEGIVGADYVKEVTTDCQYVYTLPEDERWPYNPSGSEIFGLKLRISVSSKSLPSTSEPRSRSSGSYPITALRFTFSGHRQRRGNQGHRTRRGSFFPMDPAIQKQ